MTDEPKTTETTPGETIAISSLDNFVKLLVRWHSNKVRVLEHTLQMPEGNEMQVGDDAPIKLEGEVLRAFKAGVNFALMELGTLPFAVEFEPESANDEAPASGG